MKKIISYTAIGLIGLIASPIAILFLMLLVLLIGGVIIAVGGLVTAILASLVPILAFGGILLVCGVGAMWIIDRLREHSKRVQ